MKLVMGVVASTSPLEVLVWGDADPTPVSMRLASYTPDDDDIVVMLWTPAGLMILGERVVV